MSRYLVLALLVAAVSAAGCSREEPPSEAERAAMEVNRGLALARGGKTDQAIERFRESLRLDPDNINAYYNLAVAYSEKGEHGREAEYYLKVIEHAPRAGEEKRRFILSATHYNLAILALLEQDKPKALEHLARALETTGDKDLYFHDLKSDPDLEPLRGDPRFKALIEKHWPEASELQGVLPREGARPPRPPGP